MGVGVKKSLRVLLGVRARYERMNSNDEFSQECQIIIYLYNRREKKRTRQAEGKGREGKGREGNGVGVGGRVRGQSGREGERVSLREGGM
jgi:hypothetical protein